MQIIISGRHFSVTEEMKSHITYRLNDVLDIQNLKISTARVTLDLQKTRCIAEIIVNLKNHDFETKVESYDMFESIDAAIEKIQTQARRLLDKVQDHHHNKPLKDVEPKEETGEIEEPII